MLGAQPVPFGGAMAPTFLLDEPNYPTNVQYAFGLTRLISGYNGNVIRLQRTGDNATSDFGFAGNELDEADIESWVDAGGGTKDGHVIIWYSQVGGVSLVVKQGTYTSYPLLVDNAAMLKLNGKPAMTNGTECLREEFTGLTARSEMVHATVFEQTAAATGIGFRDTNNTAQDSPSDLIQVDAHTSTFTQLTAKAGGETEIWDDNTAKSGKRVVTTHVTGATEDPGANDGEVDGTSMTFTSGASLTTLGTNYGKGVVVGGRYNGTSHSQLTTGKITLVVGWHGNSYASNLAAMNTYITDNIA